MEILDVKTQNLDQIEHLVEMEKESGGILNGRQMIVARSSVSIRFRANLIELLAIKKISNYFSVSMVPPGDDNSYNEAFKMFTTEDYSNIVRKESCKYLNLPIGVTEYNGVCSFYGSNIRILTKTGNFGEFVEYMHDDKTSLSDTIAKLFYQAIYMHIMHDLDFDYTVADKFFSKNLYSRLPNKTFTVMRVFLKDGIGSVPFISSNPKDVSAGINKIMEELKENVSNYGSHGLTVEISCFTSLYFFFILKILGKQNIVIDEEPINLFIKKDHVYMKETEWSKTFDNIDKTKIENVIAFLGLMPANAKIHYTINVTFAKEHENTFDNIFESSGDILHLLKSGELNELKSILDIILNTTNIKN